MPGNHKPRKRLIPKRDHFAAMSAIERMQMQQHRARPASSPQPLDKTQVRDLLLYCHSALEAIRTGQGNDDHANHLALASNISLVLCEQGLGREWVGKVQEAQDAIVMLGARRRRIGRYVATGTELQRIQALLELHDQQMVSEHCTEGLMAQALAEIQRRVASGAVVEVHAA
jgi:hypothetical protein